MFKKLLLWVILAFGLIAQTQAQGIIIQGYVRLGGTNQPVPNQPVHLRFQQISSTTSVLSTDSTGTDSIGFFSVVFNPTINPTSIVITASTFCGGLFIDSVLWTPGNSVVTFNLFCSQMPPATLSGLATPAVIGDTILFSLYRITSGAPVLESTFTNWYINRSADMYYTFSTNSVPNSFTVKAEFTPRSPSAANFLPTWYGNTANASNAVAIPLNPNEVRWLPNIVLQPRPVGNITGTVTGNMATNPAQNDSIRMILIEVQNNTWTPVDTFYTTDSMGVAPFFKSTTRTGTHSLLVSLMGSNAANFVPTYFGNATTWSSASTFNLSSGSTVVISIALQAAGGTGGGGGSAGGGVNQGGLPITGSTGMAGVQLQLHNLQGQVLRAVHTNAQGVYNMSNLAFGSYKMHVEMMGMPFTPYPFTLSSSNPNAELHFTVNQTGIAASLVESGVRIDGVYPNPATDVLNINLSSRQSQQIELNLLDITGRKLRSEAMLMGEGENTHRLSLEGIPAGIYLLEMRGTNSISAQRIVIQ